MKHAWHRKLGVPQPCAVSADAEALYKDALNKFEHDILAKMNGCGEMGEPDKNDWIITCEAQEKIYPLYHS